jgi:hypothetical protein
MAVRSILAFLTLANFPPGFSTHSDVIIDFLCRTTLRTSLIAYLSAVAHGAPRRCCFLVVPVAFRLVVGVRAIAEVEPVVLRQLIHRPCGGR